MGQKKKTYLLHEVAKAIRSMPKKKAPGPDDITIEMVQALDDFGIEWLTALANKIYDEGHFPDEMNKSIFLSRYLETWNYQMRIT